MTECQVCQKIDPQEEVEIRKRVGTFCDAISADPSEKRSCEEVWDDYIKGKLDPYQLQGKLYANYGKVRVDKAKKATTQTHGFSG